MVQPFDPTASKPLMLLTVSSKTKDGKELYDLAYYNLRQMLSSVPGIVAPAAYGGTKRRINIYVDPVKLEAYGLSQTEVNDAVKANTTMIPSGVAEIGMINYAIDAKGMIINVEDFDDIIITHKNGKPIYIKDIRGFGLMIAIELTEPCAELVSLALATGLLINVTAGSVVRLLPALITTDEQADDIVERVSKLIKVYSGDDRGRPRT